MYSKSPLFVLTAIFILNGSASAQPVHLDKLIGGMLVGDLTLDTIYLTRDLNGDGICESEGEVTVYFDASNMSGLPAPTASVFGIFLSADRSVYYADGGSDSVYRLIDSNNDLDALDVDEAAVWFSSADNFHGFSLPAPNGIWQNDDGAVFIINAGTGGEPFDALYKTQDLNNDGDANDENEATLFFDMQNLLASSTPFDVVMIGSAFYYADLQGGDPDAIYRAEDTNKNGSIEPGEYGIFIDEGNPYQVLIGTALATDGSNLFVTESLGGSFQSVMKLKDLNASGTVDDASEVTEIWNEKMIPKGYVLSSSFSLGIGPGGQLAVGSAGADASDNIFRLIDENSDGDFLDDGETTIWAHANSGPDSFIANPRAIQYALAGLGDLDGNGAVGTSDLLILLASWGPCDNCDYSAGCLADLDNNCAIGTSDLLILLANWG